MAMPDFVGIGAQKAGTTWLYDMLAQNPSIWLPPLKEVHFFDSLGGGAGRKQLRNEHIAGLADRMERGMIDKGSDGESAAKAAFLRSLVGDHLHTPEWYASIFDHPDAKDRVAGEITPAYLELKAPRLRTLAQMLPTTKFIAIIREPAARAMSQLKMAVTRSKTTPKGKAQWSAFLERIATRGNYSTSIPLWYEAVGAERMLIRPFGMVRNEPAELIRDIEDFIGAQRFDGYKSMTEAVHQTKDIGKIPAWVVKEVEEMAAPQKDYLIQTFGEEFFEKTR